MLPNGLDVCNVPLWFYYQKHKIFLYKEDFNKFQEAFNSTIGHVKEELLPDVDFSEFDREYESDNSEE